MVCPLTTAGPQDLTPIMIPFNKPYSSERELGYIRESLASGHMSGNGPFTRRCYELLKNQTGGKNCLLTTSCTDALEMAALLLDISPGDEVIVPSFTFVSTALAFSRQGAKIVFADSRPDDPRLNEGLIEKLITARTKAIIPVHYGGKVCDMDQIIKVAGRHNLWVVEDAAHAFGSSYNGRPAGTIGHLGAFSFHETKILHCGEGGMLSVNDPGFAERAEIIWEKGTNRCEFNRGKVPFYEWKDTGSSFLMPDTSAAFLLAQLENRDQFIKKRREQWELYYHELTVLKKEGFINLPEDEEGFNYFQFHVIARNSQERDQLKIFLYNNGIQAITHYRDLSQSHYILSLTSLPVPVPVDHSRDAGINNNSLKFQDTLLRLPLFYELKQEQIEFIAKKICNFYEQER